MSFEIVNCTITEDTIKETADKFWEILFPHENEFRRKKLASEFMRQCMARERAEKTEKTEK